MTINGWLQIVLFLAAVAAVTRPAGRYMTLVFTGRQTWLDPVLRPLERMLYRLCGIDPAHEMRWTEYAAALLGFSAVSMLLLYAMQRLQGWLPFNPQGLRCRLHPFLVQHRGVVRHQHQLAGLRGESTMSYLTQMAGLAYHNFVSAAVGMALAIAFIRGIARREQDTLGNFWVDMTRGLLWVLLPVCLVGALLFVSQGVVQNLKPFDVLHTVEGGTQTIAQGPVAVAGNHQAVRHQRRRLLQRQQRASLRESRRRSPTSSRCSLIFAHPGRFHLHARRHDRVAAARLGGVGGDGLPLRRRRHHRLLGGSARQPAARGRRRSAGGQPVSPAATWRARRCASASPTRRCSPP